MFLTQTLRAIAFFLILLPGIIAAQVHFVGGAEYFWDTDPGAGNATPLLAADGNFNQAIEQAILQTTIPGSLSIGAHKFNVRMKNNLNQWGPVFTTIIDINEPTTALREIKITAAEYFWDNDPGQGNGTPMLAFDGNFNQAIEQVFFQTNIPGSLSIGIHKLSIRVQDAENSWSPIFSVIIDINEPTTALREIKVTAAEYFWDTDPGLGNGTPMLAFDGNFNQAIEQATMQTTISGALTVGNHILNYRVRDAENAWSPLFRVVVTINEPTTALRQIYVAAAEYWFDEDPGAGNGTPMLAVDGNFNSVIEAIKGGEIPSPVTAGIHVLWMRAKEPQGSWGPAFGIVVNMDIDIGTFTTQISGPTDLCAGSAQLGVNYSCVAASGSTYLWSISSGVIMSGQGTTSITVNWNAGGPHTLTLEQCIGANCQTAQITVTISSAQDQTQNISICQGQSFFAGGANQTQAGTYTDNMTTGNGCSYVLTTNLTVNPLPAQTQNVTICQGQSFFAGGANQTQSGTYTDPLTVNGCTGTLTTILTVNPSPNSTQNVTICQGESFFAGGAFQTQSGTYVDPVTENGCTGSLTTNLTVIPAPNSTQNITICQGESYFAGGANQTQSGTYTDPVTVNGCTGTLTTILTVSPLPAQTQSITICEGQSFFAGGANQTQSGTYVDPLTVNGCTGTLTTNLTVTPAPNTSQNISICQGQTFFAGGANQSQPGIYTDQTINAQGCLQILTTNLSVNPTFNQSVEVQACIGSSYFVGGGFQTQPGLYTDVFQSQFGCDSVVVTNLSFTTGFQTNASATICQGQSIFLGGAMQTQPGIYVDLYTSVGGCDSLVTTTLNVLFPQTFNANAAICQGQTILLGGALQSQPGQYTDIFTNAAGCDSVVVTTLVVHSVSNLNASINICQGDSLFVGGAWQSAPGVFTDVFQSQFGCDSTVVTNLNILLLPPTPAINPIGAGQMQCSVLGQLYQWTIVADGCPDYTFETSSAIASIQDHLNATECPSTLYGFTVSVFNGNCWSLTSPFFEFDTFLSEIQFFGDLILYPNPSRDWLHIDYRNIAINPGKMVLTFKARDAIGKEVGIFKGHMPFALNVTEWSAGEYFIGVEELGVTLRFVKTE